MVNFIHNNIIYHYGVLLNTITNNRKSFYNILINSIYKRFGFKQNNPLMYNKPANGIPEALTRPFATYGKQLLIGQKEILA